MDSGRTVAADAKEASALNISENIAGKAALRDVGSLERKHFADGTAVIVVESWIPTAALTDLIYSMQLTSMDFDIVGFSGAKVALEVRP